MDQYFMGKAIELAKLGEGKTRPNPLVGAVIVKNGEIIATGYHHFYGGDHAEVDALKKIDYFAEGMTMYVNLEPCSHYGKTPPCVDAIMKSKLKRVVIAMEDPNPKVAGRGVKILKENGIEVKVGVLEKEAKRLNEIFIKYITTGLPFCILKTAVSLDGKIATVTGDSKWITGEDSRAYVHEIRHRAAGIMVGISTILKDNPRLNTRIPGKEVNQPVRIVIDSYCKTPLDCHVIKTTDKQPTFIVTTENASKERIMELKKNGAEVVVVGEKAGRVNLKEMMVRLGQMKIDSVLLEGGGTLNYSALEEGIVDKILYFIAPKIIGGKDAITSVEGKGKDWIHEAIQVHSTSVRFFQEDILIEGYIEGKEDGCLQES